VTADEAENMTIIGIAEPALVSILNQRIIAKSERVVFESCQNV
jgi:hypothetical protein